MWETEVDGQPLKFHLAGINNQNFIMRDETTSSWWQQVSGAAIHGPLKGKQLKQVFVDEISFAVWKREHPNGRVLRPDEKFKAKYDLPYSLLADTDKKVCAAFGVIKEKNMYGKKVMGIERTTFLIGPDGKLAHIFPKVKAEGHAEEVLAALASGAR